MRDLISLIGAPFGDRGRGPDTFDCYGLVRHALGLLGRPVPPDHLGAYTGAHDRRSVPQAFVSGLAQGWQRLDGPEPGAMVLLLIGGRPLHCGLVIDSDRFLHVEEGKNAVIERLDSPKWANRIEGYWRFDE